MKRSKPQFEYGFTLVEILVSTAIFVMVVSAMLTLFNYTLQINRRVQSLREVVQGTRTFTESLTREIRNGRIDYSSWSQNCQASSYANQNNKSLAILTRTGDELCFFLGSDNTFYLEKHTATGDITEPIFYSNKFRLNPSSLHLYVRPTTDPKPSSSAAPGIQPFVTITAQFELTASPGASATTLNYETTVSTDVYDIPAKPNE